MSKSRDTTAFENFSDEDLILAISQGYPAAQEYAVKRYRHELFQILKPLATKERTMDLLFAELISHVSKMIAKAEYPYKFTLLTILIKAATIMIDTIEQNSSTASWTLPLNAYFDMSQFTSDEVADIIHLLSDTYRSIGGDGLVIKKIDFLDFSPVSQS